MAPSECRVNLTVDCYGIWRGLTGEFNGICYTHASIEPCARCLVMKFITVEPKRKDTP